MITVRPERSRDHEAIREVLVSSFPTTAEADLVEALRDNGHLLVSLVAEWDGQVVGHIAFSPITVESETVEWQAVGLAPLAVAPHAQRMGFGSALMYAGLESCRQQGHEVAFVLGDPKYYTRFGFAQASEHSLRWERDVPPEVFLVQALQKNALFNRSGIVRYSPEFDAL